MRTAIVAAMSVLLTGFDGFPVSSQPQAPLSPQVSLSRLAIDLGATVDPAPILLGSDRANPVAAVYDRFTRAHLTARAAAQRNSPLDALKPPANFIRSQLM